jgi:hypothetical protein
MSFKAEVTIQKFDVKDKHGIFERWTDWRAPTVLHRQ